VPGFKKLKHDCVYWGTASLFRILNLMPRSPAVFTGAVIGYLAYLVIKKDRMKGDRSLRLVYGDELSPGQRRAIIRNLFINFGKNIVDVIRFKRHYRDQIKNLVDCEGLEYFENAYNKGRGVIAVTGHIGNFELLAAHFVELGYAVAVIGREVYDVRLNEMLVANREAMGLVNIDTRDSPRSVLKALKKGYAVGVLIDTDSVRVRGAFMPFLGRLAHTPVGQSILGLRAGAAFVPMACVRNGKRYKIIVRPEIVIRRTDDFESDVYNITRKCNEVLEEIVDQYKDQWIWIHSRWRTEPKETIRK
jgi:KDO2-lipid IV(A) lauroyltransferase